MKPLYTDCANCGTCDHSDPCPCACHERAKKDAARLRRNAGAKERADARRLLGLKRTTWGWE